MPLIHFVRHGKAAGGIDQDRDPGLDATGRLQAETTAADLAQMPRIPLLSSPLKRAQETAIPLAQAWQSDVLIEPRVAEIPFDTTDLAERAAWLSRIMPGRWSDLEDALQRWRADLIDFALEQRSDVIVFSHFIAINVVVGAAQKDDHLVVFRPDNASVTTLDNAGSQLRVVELGLSADTKVN